MGAKQRASETADLVDRSTNGAAWIIQSVRDNSTVKQRETEDDLHRANEQDMVAWLARRRL